CDGGLWIEESDPLLVSSPRRAPLDTSRHHGFTISIQTSQGLQGSHGFQGENVRVGVLEVASDFQLSRCHESPFWKITIKRRVPFPAADGWVGAKPFRLR